jgi:SsrA-binding protein
MSKKKKDTRLVFRNKRAYFDYEISDKYEAGIMLQGTEVKSIRAGKVSLVGSFCYFNSDGELFIKDMDIAIYEEGSYNNHEPKRERKLLMHKKELVKLKAKFDERGFSVIPLRLYPNERNIFKVEIGLAKGRKKQDKRDYIKDRETKREMKDALGRG